MAEETQTGFDKLSFDGLTIVVSQHGATTTIALDGEWDLAQREKTRHAVQSALAAQPDRVVLDLSRLTFIDSTGVTGVLELATQATRLNIDLEVIPCPPAIRRVLDLANSRSASRSSTLADLSQEPRDPVATLSPLRDLAAFLQPDQALGRRKRPRPGPGSAYLPRGVGASVRSSMRCAPASGVCTPRPAPGPRHTVGAG